VDEAYLFNPGQLLRAPIPNYIKLDMESGELSWHTVSSTWIPEDGLHDHLVLKFVKDLRILLLSSPMALSPSQLLSMVSPSEYGDSVLHAPRTLGNGFAASPKTQDAP
jgi:hypothetical protein